MYSINICLNIFIYTYLMNQKNQVSFVASVTDEWVKYIEIFSSSTVTISDFTKRGYSLSDIDKIFRQAVTNRQEIELAYY